MLARQLARDVGLRNALGRYQVIGEAIRGSLPQQRGDFAAGVMAAIDSELETGTRDEATGLRETATGGLSRFGRPLAGMAVAASVAMLAITTLQRPGPDSGDAGVASEVVPASATIGSNPVVPARQVDFSNVDSPELQNQLRSYLMNHNEHAGNSRLRGVMPYVQIAAQDSRPVDATEEPEATAPAAGGSGPDDPQF